MPLENLQLCVTPNSAWLQSRPPSWECHYCCSTVEHNSSSHWIFLIQPQNVYEQASESVIGVMEIEKLSEHQRSGL